MIQSPRDALAPDALGLIDAIGKAGSFAAAARALGLVPSALSYRVRQIEDVLDVLLFDRSSRQAVLTPAGAELLREGRRLLQEADAIAARVKRVATGWEPQLTIATDSVISHQTLMELAQAFFAQNAPTQLRIREEVLTGTLDALVSGRADLALGVNLDTSAATGLKSKPLGMLPFVYCVAPHHPLAHASEPLADELLRQHRAVAVADSLHSGSTATYGLLAGQQVFTVSTMQAKLDAQLRGLGVGFLPEPLARPYLQRGALIAKAVERETRQARPSYAWRSQRTQGQALQWWLKQLDSAVTRSALLGAQPALDNPVRSALPRSI